MVFNRLKAANVADDKVILSDAPCRSHGGPPLDAAERRKIDSAAQDKASGVNDPSVAEQCPPCRVTGSDEPGSKELDASLHAVEVTTSRPARTAVHLCSITVTVGDANRYSCHPSKRERITAVVVDVAV